MHIFILIINNHQRFIITVINKCNIRHLYFHFPCVTIIQRVRLYCNPLGFIKTNNPDECILFFVFKNVFLYFPSFLFFFFFFFALIQTNTNYIYCVEFMLCDFILYYIIETDRYLGIWIRVYTGSWLETYWENGFSIQKIKLNIQLFLY